MSIYEGKEPYLFISYSHTDNDVIGEITQMLDENGCRYWYDMGLHSGNDWNEVVASKLRDSAACLLLLSPTAASSKYVKNELTLVENMEIPLHPVLIKDYVGASIRDLPTDIAMTIARIQMVSMECNYRKKILRGLPSSVFAQINEDDFKIRALYNLEKYNGNGGDVIVPDGVTSIGDSAFAFCSDLTSITIPDGVTSVGDSAFRVCSSLTSITIPDGVMSIGDSAFRFCSSLTSITIPDSVTYIGDSAFEFCRSLTSITLPDSVPIIGNSTFRNCSSLTSITIPNSVMYIGKYAFEGCSGLASLAVDEGNTVYHSVGNCIIRTKSKTLVIGCKNSVIPTDGSVTSINDSAFCGCNDLTSITIPDGVTSIGDSAFCFCRSLASITIPDSVTQIGEDAFYWCSELTCITIPDSVIHIGEGAFVSCTSLVNITIPNRVTGIRRYAFDGCSGLTSITIPDSVTSIDDSAFNNCQNLTSITFQGTKAQWNAIIKGCDWNADTGNYTVYCTDGSISK